MPEKIVQVVETVIQLNKGVTEGQINQHEGAIVPAIWFSDICSAPEICGKHLWDVLEGSDDGIVDNEEMIIPDKPTTHERHVHRKDGEYDQQVREAWVRLSHGHSLDDLGPIDESGHKLSDAHIDP